MSQATFSVSDIRKTFLDFFESKGHTVVASSPLVPGNDPTLMFTNSGMVQFKDVFLGSDKRSYVRAASVQACLRAGGKHNDLENVGYTARHHTFFEMLGNWSFGDYFKRESLEWAWELLTQVYKLPADKLYATVYMEDDEAHGIWEGIFVKAGWTPERIKAENRIIRIGDNKGGRYKSDNFWMMADTGPCGPCSEIFYDHGAHIPGGPPGSPDEDGDRFIEIWNNVFMQFNMDETGAVTPLPAPCVDTGMGLERLAAILQHVHSNYEIDLFQALIRKASELTGMADLENKSLRVIADHIRACSFLIVDGVLPSNEGRGYVLRRIIRRALRHGWMLGVRQPFFSKLVPTLVEQMGEAYPELPAAVDTVTRALQAEEERFAETLDAGMKIFEDVAGKASNGVIPGVDAFRLYDTYGFPLDLTQDEARRRGFSVNVAGFEDAMAQQRERSREHWKGSGQTASTSDWLALRDDYGRIRDLIEQTIAGFTDFNARIQQPCGFHLDNSAAQLTWNTASGSAEFRASTLPHSVLPECTRHAEQMSEQPVLLLQSLRSHDQYNTTIYGLDDRYRGVRGQRDVLFVNEADIIRLGFKPGQKADIVSLWDDGVERRVKGFTLLAFDIPAGQAAAYYPEVNPLVPLESIGDGSHTPTSKFVAIRLEAASDSGLILSKSA